ncbi:MAG: hypothetical protein K1W00_00245 [Lachnospiraceae bacterium]|mgnify:CR=1 FL=1
MPVQWVKDVDSGELFPVVDDESFDIPDHLKDADYNEVDYDKTTKYTIGELQNQLLAAQNQINEIKQDTHSNVVSEPLEELPTKTVEISKSHFDWSKLLKYVAVPVACVGLLVLSLCGLKILSDEGLIEFRTNENVESVSTSDSKVSISPVPVYGKIPVLTDGNGMYYYIDRDNSADSKTETSDIDTSEDDETETENNPLLKLASLLSIIAVPFFTLKLTMSFLRNNFH